MEGFRERPAPIRRFAFNAIEPRYEVHGWKVKIDRPALEFSRLEVDGKEHARLSGSGDATVRTPADYKPRARYRVQVRNPEGGARQTVRASKAGRLRFDAELGPGNPFQEYTDEADQAGGTQTYTAEIRISRRR
jgi:hypothetical protein